MSITNVVLSTIVVLVLVGLFGAFAADRYVSWGSIRLSQDNVVAVTGYAEGSEGNRVATYNVGVNAIDADKQVAVDKVNSEMANIINKLKEFGIPADDIKTQNMSIYQIQEPGVSVDGASRTRLGDWSASNNIEVRFEFDSQEKLTELTNILAMTGANNVWGPNFGVNTQNTMDAKKGLLDAAIKNAREKAEAIASSSGRSLGKIISVTEGGANNVYPMMDKAMGMGGGGGYIEPGTSQVSQSVTVVFELK